MQPGWQSPCPVPTGSVCCEHRFGHASGWDEAAELAMTQGPRCVVSGSVVCEEPGEDVECWQAGNAGSAGPLRRLDVAVELVSVKGVGLKDKSQRALEFRVCAPRSAQSFPQRIPVTGLAWSTFLAPKYNLGVKTVPRPMRARTRFLLTAGEWRELPPSDHVTSEHPVPCTLRHYATFACTFRFSKQLNPL